ncbi:MAG: hypothetical protein EP330_01050 [Deltaproteobacteria bacterium]|nr:MAG: hypothetical protein EP330_01050 [Deltaproteobacteria bacterium]
MKQGDTFKDAEGLSWTVGEPLGRGSFARSWQARSEDGRDAVLKVPLTPADVPNETPVPEGVDIASKKALLELADLLRAGERPFLPRLIGVVDLESGKRKTPKSPGLLLHRYPNTLAKKLGQGASVGETLKLLATVLGQLETLVKDGRIHGNLRPENVLINESGEPVLADPVTATSAEWRQYFATLSGRPSLLPPEAEGPREADDAFALCAMAWLGSVAQTGVDPRQLENRAIPVGMDKVDLATVRDAALASLKRGSANARFSTRATERLGAMLSRGLSGPVEPSPPYRFLTLRDLAPRLREVASLVDPHVANVGKVLLSANADAKGVFSGGDPVAFSVSCGATSENIGHEDIAIGLQVVDLDAEGDGRVRVPDTKFDVASHPSGRLRFSFELPQMAPGRYGVTVAFSIKDGGHEPTLAKGEFEVRPPPGYVPPAPEPEANDAPLKLPPRPKPAPAPTLPEPEPEVHTAPDAEVVPLPIAPSSVGIAPSDPGVPPSDPGLPPEELARPAPDATVDDRTVPAHRLVEVEEDPSVGEIRTAPPVARPKPVMSINPSPPAMPTPAPRPTPVPTPGPKPVPPPMPAPAPAPAPLPMGEQPTQPRPPTPAPPPVQGPGTWEADLPNPTPAALPPADYLPGQNLDQLGEDLPTWDENKAGLPPAVQKLVEFVSNDPFTAVAALALVFAVLAAIVFSLR